MNKQRLKKATDELCTYAIEGLPGVYLKHDDVHALINQLDDIPRVDEKAVTQLIRDELWSEYSDTEAGLDMAKHIFTAISPYLAMPKDTKAEGWKCEQCDSIEWEITNRTCRNCRIAQPDKSTGSEE